MASFIPVKIKKRGNNYQLYYYNPRGERRRLTTGNNYQEAQHMAVKFNNWLMEGKDPELELKLLYDDESAKNCTLRELFLRFMEEHGNLQSKKMQSLYYERFKNISRCPKLVDIPINHVSKKIMLEYCHARRTQDHVSNATINREITVIKTMLNKAVEWEYLEKNPLDGLKLFPEAPKREVNITPEEVKALLNELTEPFALIVEYAIYTGFRLENILSLTIQQVRFYDLDNTGEVLLQVKGGKWKTFPLGPQAMDVVKRAIEDRKEGYVFINPKTCTRFYAVSKSFRRAVKKMNLKVGDSYLRFHDLRHVFASWLHKEGVSLDIIRVLLGHSNRSTTDRYTTTSTLGAGKVLSLLPSINSHDSTDKKAV